LEKQEKLRLSLSPNLRADLRKSLSGLPAGPRYQSEHQPHREPHQSSKYSRHGEIAPVPEVGGARRAFRLCGENDAADLRWHDRRLPGLSHADARRAMCRALRSTSVLRNPEAARRLFVRRLTVNEFLDIRRDQMRLVRLVDDNRTESAWHNATRQAFAKIVRLFLVVGLMAHVMSPSRSKLMKPR
jgi:hypothetical protein